MRTLFLCIMVVILSTPCFADDIKAEITQLLNEQDEAWNRGDLDGFVRPYDNSGKLIFVSDAVVRSPKELKARYEKRYKSGEADFGKLSFSELQIEELAPGIARAWGRWSVVQKEKKSSGWFTLILQKRGLDWHIIHDHSS